MQFSEIESIAERFVLSEVPGATPKNPACFVAIATKIEPEKYSRGRDTHRESDARRGIDQRDYEYWCLRRR